MRQIQGGLRHINEVFKSEPLPEPAHPQTPDRYDVVFDHVSFRYAHDYQEGIEVLHDVCFIAPAGRVTALVGPSGSGKSTAASLIPRFYDVAGGAVRIGGVDVRDVATPALLSLGSGLIN